MAGRRRMVETRRRTPQLAAAAIGLVPQVLLLVAAAVASAGDDEAQGFAPFYSLLDVGFAFVALTAAGAMATTTRARRTGIGLAQGTCAGVVVFFLGSALIHP